MVVLQAESEVAAINMVYGAAAAGKRAMTSSSSPGISLKMEGLSYMAGAELPGVVLNVVRGGPGLGTIQPSQADYFQATKGGGHGDYRLIVLAPSSVQEMYDFVKLALELTFKYRTPVMLLSDGIIGQMMEKVELSEPIPRRTDEEVIKECPWATTGKPAGRERNIITSLNLDPGVHEKHNIHLQEKYRNIEKSEVRYETFECDDAEYLYVAYGSSARIVQKSVQQARAKGIKAGLIRPITLFPFPKKQIAELSAKVKGIMAVEMSSGQLVEDVRLAALPGVEVEHYGRMGGVIPSPEEVVSALVDKFIGG
jgi:2-oxoglutarate ferredoxin oxidoreductase subunit alpha